MFKFFKKTKKEPENLKEIWQYLQKLEKILEMQSREFEDFKEKNKKTIQKVGMLRFNPFKEAGGDQSFSIALLDADNNGLVITSHYGRESNRVYAKPIEGGTSRYQLSDEERQAIENAISQKT